MKIAISIFAFIFTLTVAHVTLADEHGTPVVQEHGDKAASEHAANENGNKTTGELKGTDHGGKTEAEITTERMRALFPPKQSKAATMAAIPAKTELQEPSYFAKIADSKVNLKWKAVEGADLYHVQVATDPNFKWLVADEFAVKTNSFEVANLQPGNHYYWRVNSVKENNEPTHRKSGFVTSMFETK